MNAYLLFVLLPAMAVCHRVPRPRWLRFYIPPHLLDSPFCPPGTPPGGSAHRKDTPS